MEILPTLFGNITPNPSCGANTCSCRITKAPFRWMQERFDAQSKNRVKTSGKRADCASLWVGRGCQCIHARAAETSAPEAAAPTTSQPELTRYRNSRTAPAIAIKIVGQSTTAVRANCAETATI